MYSVEGGLGEDDLEQQAREEWIARGFPKSDFTMQKMTEVWKQEEKAVQLMLEKLEVVSQFFSEPSSPKNISLQMENNVSAPVFANAEQHLRRAQLQPVLWVS